MRLTFAVLALTLFALPASAQLTCKTSNYGKGCGPVLRAVASKTGNTQRVALTVTKAAPSSKLILMIGAARLDMPLAAVLPKAAASCRLLVAPVFLQQHNVGSNGSYTYARAVPSTASGTGHVQFLELRTDGKVLATNGASVECKVKT